jgi:ATP-dependent Lhr-like helicase
VRRGYFVSGLGAAQFALPGAVDRLRSCRRPVGAEHVPTYDELEGFAELERDERPAPVVLAATDPAQPYGAALSWPEAGGSARAARAAGGHVVLDDGDLAAYVERGGRSLVTFEAAGSGAWAHALAAAVKDGRLRSLEVGKVDGEPAATSPHAEALRAAGFADGYKGLTLRS